MYHLDLSSAESKELKKRMKETKNTKVLRRLQCIHFVHEEEPRQRIGSRPKCVEKLFGAEL